MRGASVGSYRSNQLHKLRSSWTNQTYCTDQSVEICCPLPEAASRPTGNSQTRVCCRMRPACRRRDVLVVDAARCRQAGTCLDAPNVYIHRGRAPASRRSLHVACRASERRVYMANVSTAFDLSRPCLHIYRDVFVRGIICCCIQTNQCTVYTHTVSYKPAVNVCLPSTAVNYELFMQVASANVDAESTDGIEQITEANVSNNELNKY